MSITFEDLDRDGLIAAVKNWAKSCHEIELLFVDSEERNKALQERVEKLEGALKEIEGLGGMSVSHEALRKALNITHKALH
jgi:hypothetical protein